jgi:hypothetical protein
MRAEQDVGVLLDIRPRPHFRALLQSLATTTMRWLASTLGTSDNIADTLQQRGFVDKWATKVSTPGATILTADWRVVHSFRGIPLQVFGDS